MDRHAARKWGLKHAGMVVFNDNHLGYSGTVSGGSNPVQGIDRREKPGQSRWSPTGDDADCDAHMNDPVIPEKCSIEIVAMADKPPHLGSSAQVRVSVVVPSCDRRAQIVVCVESLLRQTLIPAEIVVVDDYSRDGTAEAILALLPNAGGTSLRIIRNGRNLGANASRNVGVAASSGHLIAFLDSDCEASRTWLENIVQPFSDPSVGAVSGLVEDTCQSNIWERAFAGTHRLPRRGPISRFTSCNLCVRRDLLLAHRWEEDFSDATRTDGAPPDISFSGRCDEEGLYLAIRAAQWAVLAEPSAVLQHHHAYSARSFMRQAYYGGRAAAELVWKFRLRDRLDVAPFLLALLATIVAVPIAYMIDTPWAPWMLLVPLLPLCAGIAAVSWNETARKGKTLVGLLRAAPALAIYYVLRCTGYAVRRVELVIGIEPVQRISPNTLAVGMPSPGVRR